MSFVIDSSVALSWCFPDEATAVTAESYEIASQTELVVPPLWHVEMAHVLGLNLRRGRITTAALDEVLSLLSRLNIQTEPLREGADIAAYAFQMRIHQLTAYDVTYLMLARQQQLPIATFDREIIAAAQRAGVPLIQFPGT